MERERLSALSASYRSRDKKNQRVKTGDELGCFSYGGSTLALVFQKDAIRRFSVRQPDPGKCTPGSTLNVNSKIAVARESRERVWRRPQRSRVWEAAEDGQSTGERSRGWVTAESFCDLKAEAQRRPLLREGRGPQPGSDLSFRLG